ncbi:uncharacterized protein LOC129723031 [Wyeomyia smithii]|uniref:uncharacterized protein LOC129723031 n=1 Tax=Wyeomyia smithii TaxID=174621 RepID=UPI002467E53F|nr:uncharacterized protein LOC129723031 [Wyeomyia smithii]
MSRNLNQMRSSRSLSPCDVVKSKIPRPTSSLSRSRSVSRDPFVKEVILDINGRPITAETPELDQCLEERTIVQHHEGDALQKAAQHEERSTPDRLNLESNQTKVVSVHQEEPELPKYTGDVSADGTRKSWFLTGSIAVLLLVTVSTLGLIIVLNYAQLSRILLQQLLGGRKSKMPLFNRFAVWSFEKVTNLISFLTGDI